MPSTTLTIDQIEISPFNVRTHRPDAEDTGALEASILADGLLNPVVVHPMLGRKGKWGAVAGGRRTRAIRALVGRGDLPADYPVKVDIRADLGEAELIEVSIAENLLRKDLRDHELYAAIARAKAKGHDPETIARQLGQHDIGKVRKWARLGELAKPVFAALVDGRIGTEIASAYAATADVALQAAIFTRLTEGNGYHTAAAVRTALKVGDREEARLLTFVGEAVYRAAGGGYELDLFADVEPDRGRVTDPDLLRRLAEERIASIRDEVRTRNSVPDLRFVPEPPQTEWGGPDYQLQVTPKRDGDRLDLPAPAKGNGPIVAHVAIDAGGEPVISYWWESRKAKFGSDRPDKPVSAGPVIKPIGDAIADVNRIGARAAADAAIKEEEGLTQDNILVARAYRRQILRGLLIDDARAGGDVAADYLVWSQLRMLVARGTGNTSSALGIRSLSESSVTGAFQALQKITDALGEQPATRTIAQALFELESQTFVTDPDLGDAFLDFRCSPTSLKRLAAAVVTGIALEGSLAAPGYARRSHEVAVWQMLPPMAFVDGYADEQVRRHWTPKPSFLTALPKPQLLAIAEPFVDAKTHAAWGKLKSAELVDHVARVLAGAHPSIKADAREAAARWVHPLLRFDPPPRDPEPEEDHNANDTIREAAE